MKRIISALVASSLLLAGQALAAPDAVVFDGGDVRIKGSGNGLVFSDNTRQTTAAEGVSKLVHGTVVGASVPSNSSGAVNGTGFYVNRTTTGSVGTYKITFSPAFSTPPDCVITPVGHSPNINAYVACELSTLSSPTFSAERATVECRYYYPYATPTLIDDTFTFICVE